MPKRETKGVVKGWVSQHTGEHRVGCYSLSGETLTCIGDELHACSIPMLLVDPRKYDIVPKRAKKPAKKKVRK